MKFLLGTKIGMTSYIDEQGAITPVTVVQAGPVVVTQLRTPERDGYAAVQVGYGERKARAINKPLAGHLQASGATSQHLAETRVAATELDSIQLGATFDVTQFAKGDKVKVAGTTKGKGFAGTVKRYGFKGGPASHGHPDQRRPGSIGSTFPQRTIKGLRMSGHMGNTRRSVLGLTIVDIDTDKNLLILKGSVPGVKGRLLEIYG